MIRRAVLASLVALLGCSSSNGAAPDAGAPGTCSSDAECGAGFRCDRAERRCVCTGDEACPGGFCNAFTGACVASVPGCHDDSVCNKGEYCDRAVRSCKPITGMCGACKTDAQCGADSRCAAHPQYPQAGTFCVPTCVTPDGGGAAGCANGLQCLPRDATAGAEKLCYPATGACGISNACTPDTRRLCSSDSDCGDASQVCDATLKWCVTKVNTCPAGDACDPQQRVCVHACAVDADCLQIEGAAGYKCVASACVKQAICSSDAECNDGQICQANPDGSKSCAQGCVINGDCPLGESCDKTDPKHPKCAAGCTVNADCPLNAICSGGVCKSSLSGSAGSCAQTCQATDACAVASRCNPASSCCDPANLAQACGPNAAICGTCATNGSCTNVQTACNSDCYALAIKACASQNDCPTGTNCTAARVCQAMVHLTACNDDSNCWRGFHCRLRSTVCGSTATGSVCMPDVAPAKLACVQGHL
jgi:hypothetical protein